MKIKFPLLPFTYIFVIIFTILFSKYIGAIYYNLANLHQGLEGYITPLSYSYWLEGAAGSYILFLSLFFTAFGSKRKYFWLLILMLPAIVVEVYFHWQIIYLPIFLGVIGWLVGLGIAWLLNLRKSKSGPSGV